MEGTTAVAEVADALISVGSIAVTCVAVDGVDAAGKTRFAEQLAHRLDAAGSNAVCISIDGFHRPAVVRHRRAEPDPAASFYEDSYDYPAFLDAVIRPVRGPRPRLVTPAVFDVRSDKPVTSKTVEVPDWSVLLVDGIFLGRPELRSFWDVWIYLHVDESVARERGIARDAAHLGSIDAARRRYLDRYEPGQRLYHELVDPVGLADIVVDNTDPSAPFVVRSAPIRAHDDSSRSIS